MASVKTAYTTKELAELLGVTRQAIEQRSAREGWQSRPRKGKGGGNEWLLSSMPEATRLAVATAIVAEQAREADAARCKQPVNALGKLPAARRDKAEARQLLAQMARRFMHSVKLPRTSAYEIFAARYNSGEVLVADWVRAVVSHICRASLFNWERTLAGEGAAALAGRQGRHRIGSGAMAQPYVLEFCLAHIYKFPHVGASGIHYGLGARLDLQGRPERLPSLRRLQAWYKEWRSLNEELFVYISNPDQWRSRFRAAFGDAAGLVDRLNQEWEMDSTPSDLLLSDGKRHTIVACIELFSRRVKFHVSRTSSSHAVASCLRKAITAWGVPEIVRTDNGQDYVSRHIERVLLDMDILHDLCDPFSPEQKPFVERVFRSFLHDNLELLTGFTGHNVSERKALEARKSFAQRMMDKDATVELNLSPEELQEICDRWADDTYMHRKHSKLGMSPYEQVLAYEGPVRRIENDDALRLLCLPCVDGDGTRVVSKAGGVRAFNDTYLAPQLALHIGRRVQVRVDDADWGFVHIYNLDGSEFICSARGVRHSGMSGAAVKAVANSAKRLQRNKLSAGRSELAAAAKKADVGDIAYERMRADEIRARRIEAEQPLRAELFDIHATPALASAADAAKAPDWTPSPVTESERQAREKAEAMLAQAAEEQRAPAREETAAQRYQWACRMDELLQNGGELAPDDLRRLENYKRTPEYSSQKLMWQHFSPELLQVACG